MGLRKGGPYAPQRKPVTIDWAAQQAASDAARAEQARFDEEARLQVKESLGPIDPLDGLIRRVHALEQRVGALANIVKGTNPDE